jgi:hypothetical protein
LNPAKEEACRIGWVCQSAWGFKIGQLSFNEPGLVSRANGLPLQTLPSHDFFGIES